MTADPPARPCAGRFAPSPTGPLHFGSLISATASYLDARARGGLWLLRIEDIDPPRAHRGADAAIIRALERYGFAWDGEVEYQSRNEPRHRAIIDDLIAAGRAYPCGCSRQDLADCPRGPLGIIYPGRCRTGPSGPDIAIRVRTDDRPVAFTDRLQGRRQQRLQSESGDFVILRRDGLIAYHLAVVADDFAAGITHVVRGIDLLDSTPRQIHLQRLLGYPTPDYAHVPVACNAAGRKLAKSTGAPAVPVDEVRPTLLAALASLGQNPPADLAACEVGAIWDWAIGHWDATALVGRTGVPADVPDG